MRSKLHSLWSRLAVMGLAVVGVLVALGATAAPAQAQGLANAGAVFTMTNSAQGNAVKTKLLGQRPLNAPAWGVS